MHEQHAGRAADRARSMTAAADIVSKECFAAAAPVLSPVAGFDFECTGKHDEKLAPGGRVPILIEALGHVRYHRALRRQYRGAADGIADVSRRVFRIRNHLCGWRRSVGLVGRFGGTSGSLSVVGGVGTAGLADRRCRGCPCG